MKVIIDIPNEFTGDYISDKFKDFFQGLLQILIAKDYVEIMKKK